MVWDHFPQRVSAISRPTHDGENDPPNVGRNSGRLEHLHVVLSNRLIGGIWLCPFPEFARCSESSSSHSSDVIGSAIVDAADCLACRLDSARSEQSRLLAASHADSRDRTALPHVIDYGAVTTKMVFMDGSSLGSRSLFPVFGEQCGQYAGPAGLSSVH